MPEKKILTSFELSDIDYWTLEMLTEFHEVSKVALLREWIRRAFEEMVGSEGRRVVDRSELEPAPGGIPEADEAAR